ncbi:division/cell wall cluster transcriptional repressor MraZ [Haloferula sp. A504]|uniref:division/cell wall cluster transcriptional repressor MraZ n=1 Tax=Haloferula sp. A504 TaxID=3373601 RepID=UPI0031C7B036|nr:division/cell wall cluster transcriptional repressor MraZ [Verrucomicrobiaceae bacterium E54]
MNPELHYHGSFTLTLDRDHRVRIPVEWRPEAGGTLLLLPARSFDLPMLKVMSRSCHEGIIAMIREAPTPPARRQAIAAAFMAMSHETAVGPHGKLRIPKPLCEKAALEPGGEVVVAGAGDHFMIWNPANFETMCELATDALDDDNLGIL